MRLFAKPRYVAVMVLAAVAVVAGCWPRAVPAPIATMSAAEESAMLALTKWVGCTTVQRAATISGDSAEVRICADTGTRRFGKHTPPGNNKPRAVAQIRNLSNNRVEDRWGLQPNTTYYIWLSAAPGGTTAWAIKRPGEPAIASGPLEGCGHPQATVDSASFGTCADNPYPRPGAARSGGPSSEGGKGEHTLLDRATGPAWISCTEGCCTTDAQSSVQ